MAQAHHVVHVRVVAITGVGECTVCGTLLHFRFPLTETVRYDVTRCTCCGGSLDLVESLLLPEIVIGGFS